MKLGCFIGDNEDMMKKIIVVSSTPRKGGNSEVLARQFALGAEKSGNAVEFIEVRDIRPEFCTGCMYCPSQNGCVLKDKMNDLCEKISFADILVFATPVYYYSVSGQLKTFLDRLSPLYLRKNKFGEVYLIATSANSSEDATFGAETAIKGWISCFDGAELKGVLRGVGLEEVGAAKKSAYFAMAFEMGEKA